MNSMTPIQLSAFAMWTNPSRRFAFRFDRNALAVFDRAQGTRFRFTLGSYPRCSVPELADVKITDFCDVGCDFCYMNSTPLGNHASTKDIYSVVDALASHKVFEIAYGGGETTDHPDFLDILRYTREKGIVPNFTTRKPAHVRKYADQILPYIGGFAVSAETAEQAYSISHLLRDIPNRYCVFHYVMGLHPTSNLASFLQAAHGVGWRVTLLGYKTSGRGSSRVPHNYDDWLVVVSDLIDRGLCPDLSIDTPLAAQFESLLPVDHRFFHTKEGAYSMYVDCVTMRMGASSFSGSSNLHPFTPGTWLDTYRHIITPE